ncbi:MAG: hypothetical protein JRJ00_18615 [Deltaproteobacteria bacterium]|nr:hypothetical protein [Deltaproteobacteria bacterium]
MQDAAATFKGSNGAKKAAEELWLKILSDFDNETLHQKFIEYCTTTYQLHQKFIEYCTTTYQLPLAGEKYKTYREERGDSPLIEKCMKRIVVSTQFQYLPDRERGESPAKKGLASRLFTSALLLSVGSALITLWISFPALRIFLLMILAVLLGYAVYRVRGKV